MNVAYLPWPTVGREFNAKRPQDIHIRKELRPSARDNADSFYTFLSRHIFSVPDVENV